jgi:hypothetical protein
VAKEQRDRRLSKLGNRVRLPGLLGDYTNRVKCELRKFPVDNSADTGTPVTPSSPDSLSGKDKNERRQLLFRR